MLRRAILAVALLACTGRTSSQGGPVVAEGGGISVTAGELKARLDEQSPMIRASFGTLERKKQFLDNLLKFELLARAAEKEGLANDPDVKFTMKKVMVSKYYQRFFQDPQAARSVPDSEIQKYYDEHPAEFNRPVRLHVAHVFVKAEAGSPERAAKAALARQLLAKVLADEAKDPNAFGAVARVSSDDATSKLAGGDLGFRSTEDLEKMTGKEFSAAAAKLADNQTFRGLVEEQHGFHLVRVMGRQPELHRALPEVRNQIAGRLASQRKSKEFEEFVRKLRDTARIRVNDAALEKVEVANSGGPMASQGLGAPPVHGASSAPAATPPPGARPGAPAAPARPPSPAKP
ncbi:MAG TPA: peptidyl-prolyl cis-trans isomerase [Anaeromyxobacteraceae bacterium]|nr:peptidyl-prolyl cis-trans isomerase [Anaeromyxobacteraceae bacterium]